MERQIRRVVIGAELSLGAALLAIMLFSKRYYLAIGNSPYHVRLWWVLCASGFVLFAVAFWRYRRARLSSQNG